jgi:hypothetical protein
MNRNRQRGIAPRRALLTAALAASALIGGASLATPALASAQRPDGMWSSQNIVPNISSSVAPAEYSHGSLLYVAYTTSTAGINYSIYSGTWWPKIRSVSGKGVTPSTTSSPAIAVYNGDLYVFWVNGSGQLRYTDLVGSTWAATQTVSGSWGTAESSTSPSLAVSTGALWVAYKGHTSDNIYYLSTNNGSTWSSQEVALTDATSYSPALAPTGLSAAPLAFAWTESSGAIGYGILGFLGFESIGTVPQAGTNAAPALDFMSAAPGETMYVAWKGANTKKVFYNEVANFSSSSFSPSDWAGQATLPVAYTSTGPAITDMGTTLYAVYKARSSDTIFYESATTPTS